MSKQQRRMAIMGQLPFAPKYLEKPAPIKVERKLERDGWSLSGAGFSDARMSISVYKSYFRDEVVSVAKNAAIPHYPVFSSSPDYWMWGELIKRYYIHYYLEDRRLEERGVSFHRTDNTRIIPGVDLKWDVEDHDWWVGE